MSVSQLGNGSGSGRRKSLDAEINLVPFIDLLSMCICFLLMTAVWTQLSSVQIKQANGTEAPELTQSVDLDLKFTQALEAVIAVKKAGKVTQQFQITGASETEILSRLQDGLQGLKAELTKNGLKVGAVMVTPHQSVNYGELVSFMDVFRKNEMPNIGVVPVAAN